MDQAQLLSVIGSMYDKFVADVSAKVESRLLESIIDRLNTSGMLTTEIDTRIQAKTDDRIDWIKIQQVINDTVQAKIDDLTDLDRSMITEIVRGEIEDSDLDDKISDWMSNSFDIDDHIDVNDKIDDYLSDRLTAMVKDEVRDLSFSVTVD